MARRKTKKTEEVDTTKDVSEEVEEVEQVEEAKVEEELEVTDEFNLQEVSDTPDSYEAIMDAGLTDIDTTEVEAAIEDGAEIEVIEESKPKSKPTARKNRTSVDTRVDAAAILKTQAEKEQKEKETKERQRMARVRPVISQDKKNNGIRTTAGLFYR